MPDLNLQLRFRLQNSSPGQMTIADGDWQLQWEKNGSGTWVNVTAFDTEFTGYAESNYSSNPAIGGATTVRTAETFQGNGKVLSGVKFWFAKQNAPTGTLRAELYATTGTWPTATPTGAALATSTTVLDIATQVSVWPPPGNFFAFDGSFTLTNGVVYAIALVAAASSFDILVKVDASSPQYPGLCSTYTGTWGTQAHDLIFAVFNPTDPVPSTVIANLESPYLADNQSYNTERLTGGTGGWSNAIVSEDGLATDWPMVGLGHIEAVYGITLRETDLAPDDVLRFRIINASGALGINVTYPVTPTITIGGGVPGWSASPADTAAGSDSAVPVQDFLRVPADTAAGADSATRAFAFTYDLADTAAGSDSANAVISRIVTATPADTAAGADSHTSIQTFLRTPGDTAAGSDSAVTGPDSRVRVAADGATGSDEATFDFVGGSQDVFATPADVAGGADALTLARATSPADTAAGSDAVTLLSLDERTPADTAAGSDSATTAMTRVTNPADTAAGSDLGSMIADRNRSVGDTAAGSDNVSVSQAGAVVVSADDTAVGSDAVTILATRDRSVADLAGGTDVANFQRVGFIDATPIDTAAGSDAVTVVGDRPRTADDPAAGSDLASAVSVRVRTPADTAAGADSLAVLWDRVRSPGDSAMGSEMLLGDRSVLIADLAGGADSASQVAVRDRSAADTADGSDSVTLQRAGAGSASASDSAVGSDDVTVVTVKGRTGADTAAGSDAVTKTWAYGSTPADVATAQDVGAFVWAATRPCADVAAGSDQVVTVYDRVRGLSDSALGQDDVLSELVPPVDYVVLIEDTAVGFDQATALIHVGEIMDNYCWPVDYSCCPGFDSYDNATKLRSIALAGATLRMLTAYRVGGCPITVRPCRKVCQDGYNPFGTSAFSPQNWSGTWFNCTCGGDTCGCGALCQLELPRPVGTVDAVKVDGVLLDPGTYRVDDGKWLVRTDGDCWPGCQDLSKPDTQVGTFSVTSLNAIPVDRLGQYAAGVLACEYAKACAGVKCRLPAGVTSITRQGISMEVAAGLFPNGLTGINEVDVWVQLYNPNNLALLPTVWSPNQGGKARTTTSLPAF
jgi:hypothetical protein